MESTTGAIRKQGKGVLAHSKWKICITIPFRWLISTYPKRNHSLLVKQSLPRLLDTAAKILSYCSQLVFNFYTLLGKTNAAYLILEQTTIFSQAYPLTGSTVNQIIKMFTQENQVLSLG